MSLRYPGRIRVRLDTGSDSPVKQSHKDECDIHRILKQYQRTGIVSHIAKGRPHFDNLPDPLDFQEALHTQMRADLAFASLPSSVREHFGNDPARFLYSFHDEKQHDYLRSVGLLKDKSRDQRADPSPPDSKTEDKPSPKP